MTIGLRFAPETSHHAPRMRASVFPNETGWTLRVMTASGAEGTRQFGTQAAAFAGMQALHAELNAPSPAEHVIAALCPGYAPRPDVRDYGRVRLGGTYAEGDGP